MQYFLLTIMATGHFPVHWSTSLAIRAGTQICGHICGSSSMERLQLNGCVQPCLRVSILEHMLQLVSSHRKKIQRLPSVASLFSSAVQDAALVIQHSLSCLLCQPGGEGRHLVSHVGFLPAIFMPVSPLELSAYRWQLLHAATP